MPRIGLINSLVVSTQIYIFKLIEIFTCGHNLFDDENGIRESLIGNVDAHQIPHNLEHTADKYGAGAETTALRQPGPRMQLQRPVKLALKLLLQRVAVEFDQFGEHKHGLHETRLCLGLVVVLELVQVGER